MADDLDENFQIETEFIPKIQPLSNGGGGDYVYEEIEEESDDGDESSQNKRQKLDAQSNNKTDSTKKNRRKRKNLTEILELKKNELRKPSYAMNEFEKILADYANKKLSSVEKNELGLIDPNNVDYMQQRFSKMFLKRAKTHELPVGVQFGKKLTKKLRKYSKTKQKKPEMRRSPFIIVLAQSAVRCIELQKQVSEANGELVGSLNWLYAFAKHKKLDEQVALINSKFERDKNFNVDIVYATPQRLGQLLESKCLEMSSRRNCYVFVDYSFRDVKLKRIVDHEALRADLCALIFERLLPLNREKIKLKFYLA